MMAKIFWASWLIASVVASAGLLTGAITTGAADWFAFGANWASVAWSGYYWDFTEDAEGGR